MLLVRSRTEVDAKATASQRFLGAALSHNATLKEISEGDRRAAASYDARAAC